MNFLFLTVAVIRGLFVGVAYRNAYPGRAHLAPVRFYFHIAYKWWWTSEMRAAVSGLGVVIALWMLWRWLP